MNFSRWNIIIGWLLFIFATTIYMLTLEPSVSFWDCGEWISVSYGLQVGHPPGAPLYQLIARIFSLFSFGDVTQVAYTINALSAVASGLTVMLLFWTITYFAKSILKNNYILQNRNFIILASGIIAALIYTFSDTFWFSAVESEVYALSGFFSALIFWLMLKWVQCTDSTYAPRWILLICFFIGLSNGVHYLSFLVIPAICMVYYYQNYSYSFRKTLFALLISVFALALVYKIIIPGFFFLMAETNLWLVNVFGISIEWGIGIYLITIGLLLIIGILFAAWKQKKKLHFSLLCITYLLIGISTYFVPLIRATTGTPINEGDPSNPKALYAYIQRDQYEKAPLFYGPYHTAPIEGYEDKKPSYDVFFEIVDSGISIDTCYTFLEARKYIQNDKKNLSIIPHYTISNNGKNAKYQYPKSFYTLFPRMWKQGENYEYNYNQWIPGTGKFVDIDDSKIYKPSFYDNITFFASYQLGYMYFRYFMWNFSGKFENKTTPNVFQNGEWITGFPSIDNKIVGEKAYITNQEKGSGYNVYYLLPFLLGMLGLFFQLYKDTPNTIIITTLFFFTGIAIVIFLNQPAYEPRDRDYVYSMSFYAFTIWVGMGITALFYLVNKIKVFRNKYIQLFIVTACLGIPSLMAIQNWDDHDRSGRNIAHDVAYNYLQSCAPNAILFTNGDNDTFPLWYLQEVEGIRTDVRVINLSLLAIPWYIDQVKQQMRNSKPIKLSFNKPQYWGNNREFMVSTPSLDQAMDLANMITYVQNDSNKVELEGTPGIFWIPSTQAYIKITDTTYNVSKKINFSLPQFISRGLFMHLDILKNNYTSRPIYYTDYALSEIEMLEDYLQLEGMTYRLNLLERANARPVNIEICFNNIMQKFRWGNVNNAYIDVTSREFLNILLSNIATLSNSLLEIGDVEKAKSLWNKVLSEIPISTISNEEILSSITSVIEKEENYD